MKELNENELQSLCGGNVIIDMCTIGSVIVYWAPHAGAFCAGYTFGQWLHNELY